ncbi:S1/P1 nuclease [Bdellovibrio sp. HCB337]|uniref:S1/P1 nuclease n=1 Tax=Bdellovibrio sp. HCB337 TaxID=3394358 RepID=UPI0039A5C679
MRQLQNILLVFSLVAPLGALAWGPTGHKATGYIAEANLTPEARTAVVKILGKTLLAEAVLWPDMVRKLPEYAGTKGYHFVDTPDEFRDREHLDAKEILEFPKHKAGALEAILKYKKFLAKKTGSKKDKTEALKFLIHCIGDLHQPLHSGFDGDAGGNAIQVKWFENDTNLHQVWDRGIISESRKELLKNAGKKDPGYLYAVAISEEYPSPLKTAGTVGEWYQESLDVVPAAYIGYDEDQNVYLHQYQSVVDLRVRKAGLRIAYTLNEIFSTSDKDLLIDISADDIKKFFQGLDTLIQIGPIDE